MKKVLIIDKMHDSISSMLEEIGYVPTYSPNITRKEILEIIKGFDGIIIRSKTSIDKELLDRGSNLKFIARAGAGVDQIDVDQVNVRGIKLFNAPEGNRDALGEHAVGLLLALTNNIVKADKEVREFIWDREGNRGHEIGSLTIGLFGYGNMAEAFAQRLSSFGCEILTYDKFKTGYSDNFVKEVTLEELQKKADVLSLHTPLTALTKGFINKDFIKMFQKDIWLINTSRGEVVSVEDVLSLLKSGKIKGAALDVLEKEKFMLLDEREKKIYNSLFEQSNVILSPHVAGWTFESYMKINEVLIGKIKSNDALLC